MDEVKDGRSMIDGKDVERKGCGLIKITSQRFTEGIQRN
jgi:hypothetical protein